MDLGERLSYQDTEYLYLGTDPAGLPDHRAYLEDVKTKERRAVPFAHLLALAAEGRSKEEAAPLIRLDARVRRRP